MDEAGRTTQPPLIMAPPSLKTDPDGEATDTIVDNGIMSSSRSRTGSSRSGASRQSGGANGDASSAGDTATSVDSENTAASSDTAGSADSAEDADEMTQPTSGTEVPLPAETIGKAKGRSADSSASTGNNGHGSERQGSRPAMSSGDNSWRVSQQAETATEAESVDSEASADSVASAENGTADVKSERKPSFTASAAAPASAAASTAAATSTTSTPTAAPTRSGSSYSGTAYKSPAGYPASPSAPPASHRIH